ncbi:hypothetical protein M405DRAFT_856328 [Rhizopogon salebrosus TDB-379]|nr:hypothetical protein M405DRAFT_856328 [Rhizopogon salebrosus TDB-379]
MHDSSTSEDYLSGDIMSLGDSSPGSESESDETTDFPCSNRPITPTVSPELPGILICRGYISDTDDDRPLDEHVRLTNASYENSTSIDNDDDLIYIAPSLLPRYTEQISVDNSLSFINALVDSFSFYRELREANSDSEYEHILEKLKSEWYFVGASLVALSGLDAAVFGFSSGSLFSVDSFARHSIALGSVASGIGLVIDGWFLLIYGGASSEKFQKHSRDIYGKYLFFCISSRLPAVCMFISACALMAFLIAVAWSAWPKAVLVMCFMSGILVGLQFIIYGLHYVVVCMTWVVGTVRRGFTLCKETIRQCLRA